MKEADKNPVDVNGIEDQSSYSDDDFEFCDEDFVEGVEYVNESLGETQKEWSAENWIVGRSEREEKAIVDFNRAFDEYGQGYSMWHHFNTGTGYQVVSGIAPSLNVLRLNCIDIGDEGLKILTTSLLAKMKFLSLTCCNITAGGAQFMLNSLGDNKSLTYIDLERNDIGDEGLKSLCDLMCRNVNITSLRLGRTNISDEGAKYACEALRGNRSVILFDLQDNPEYPYKLSNSITTVGAGYLDELAKNSSVITFEYPNKSQGTIELLNARKEFITKLLVRWVGGREVSHPYGEIDGCNLSAPYLEKLYKYSSSIMDSFDIMTTQVMMKCANFFFGGLSGGYTSGSPYYFEYEARRYENLPPYLSYIFNQDLEEKYTAIKDNGYNFLQVCGIAKGAQYIFGSEDIIFLISRYLNSTHVKPHDAHVCALIETAQAATQSLSNEECGASGSQYRGI